MTTKIATILSEEGKSKAYQFRRYCDKGSTLNVTKMWKLKMGHEVFALVSK